MTEISVISPKIERTSSGVEIIIRDKDKAPVTRNVTIEGLTGLAKEQHPVAVSLHYANGQGPRHNVYWLDKVQLMTNINLFFIPDWSLEHVEVELYDEETRVLNLQVVGYADSYPF